MTLGEKLKKLRGDKTLDEVAASIGVSRQAIFNYENNIRVPRDKLKVEIAKYYNKTVQEIFFS